MILTKKYTWLNFCFVTKSFLYIFSQWYCIVRFNSMSHKSTSKTFDFGLWIINQIQKIFQSYTSYFTRKISRFASQFNNNTLATDFPELYYETSTIICLNLRVCDIMSVVWLRDGDYSNNETAGKTGNFLIKPSQLLSNIKLYNFDERGQYKVTQQWDNYRLHRHQLSFITRQTYILCQNDWRSDVKFNIRHERTGMEWTFLCSIFCLNFHYWDWTLITVVLAKNLVTCFAVSPHQS